MSVALARQAPYQVRTAQRRCGKCGKLVSRAAYACRRCGKSQRVRPRIILLGLAGCLMVGMFAVASASALFGQTHPTESVAPAVSASPRLESRAPGAAGTPDISAAELWMAFSRDPAGSERRFRDHPLQVTGTIRSVDRDFEGHTVARLNTGDAFETVNATMATRDDPGVVGVSKGHAVSLLCVGRGMLMGAPQLGSCFVR
ncbi:MAG TPA: hypothetical protein VIK30_09510 [Polyangia bacterium]